MSPVQLNLLHLFLGLDMCTFAFRCTFRCMSQSFCCKDGFPRHTSGIFFCPGQTLQDWLGEKVPGRDVVKAKIGFHLQSRDLELQGLLQHATVNSD